MNKLFACLALAFVAPIFGSLYAQDDQGPGPEQYEPPPPVGLDVDYLAPAKQKLSIGFRALSGPKVSYSGSGRILSGVNPSPDANGIRRYNDGFIDPDGRKDGTSTTALQSSANADGRTNTWSFSNQTQVDIPNNGVDMHAYSGTINGVNGGSGRAASGTGFELTFERDFGWHLGRVQFDLIGGLGMNKIAYSRTTQVAGMMTTLTDVYNTFNTNSDGTSNPILDANGNPTYTAGAPNHPAPYSAPSTTTTTDASSKTVDDSTIIGSQPVSDTASSPQPTLVAEKWNINGAYFTVRGGAEMIVPITEKFSASVSGGPALVYVGTTFAVNQTITPPTGSPVTTTVSNDYSTVLPAYFADANIDYSFTDTTDLYLGAVFQSSSGYRQSIHDPNGNYTDKIDFGNQEGVRGGISFKF